MFAARNSIGMSGNPVMRLSPALWLDDTGADPSVWYDISGNSRHAVQAVESRMPAIVPNAINGRQVRRFDGVDDRMAHGLTNSVGSCTIFAITKKITDQTSYRGIISVGSAGVATGSLMLSRLAVSGRWGTYTTLDAPSTTAAGTSAFRMLCMVDNESSGGLFFIDGASAGTWSGNSLGQSAHIGGEAPQYTNSDIAEIIVFPTALSTADRQAVESYLNQKYAIY